VLVGKAAVAILYTPSGWVVGGNGGGGGWRWLRWVVGWVLRCAIYLHYYTILQYTTLTILYSNTILYLLYYIEYYTPILYYYCISILKCNVTICNRLCHLEKIRGVPEKFSHLGFGPAVGRSGYLPTYRQKPTYRLPDKSRISHVESWPTHCNRHTGCRIIPALVLPTSKLLTDGCRM